MSTIPTTEPLLPIGSTVRIVEASSIRNSSFGRMGTIVRYDSWKDHDEKDRIFGGETDAVLVEFTSEGVHGRVWFPAHALEVVSEAERFFYEHAGFSYDPTTETPEEGHWRCARGLAEDEKAAKDYGFRFEWERDEDAEYNAYRSGDESNAPQWWCLVTAPAGEDGNDWEELASLGGIILSDGKDPWLTGDQVDPYVRVVEAELASQSLVMQAEQFENEPVLTRKQVREYIATLMHRADEANAEADEDEENDPNDGSGYRSLGAAHTWQHVAVELGAMVGIDVEAKI